MAILICDKQIKIHLQSQFKELCKWFVICNFEPLQVAFIDVNIILFVLYSRFFHNEP